MCSSTVFEYFQPLADLFFRLDLEGQEDDLYFMDIDARFVRVFSHFPVG